MLYPWVNSLTNFDDKLDVESICVHKFPTLARFEDYNLVRSDKVCVKAQQIIRRFRLHELWVLNVISHVDLE